MFAPNSIELILKIKIEMSKITNLRVIRTTFFQMNQSTKLLIFTLLPSSILFVIFSSLNFTNPPWKILISLKTVLTGIQSKNWSFDVVFYEKTVSGFLNEIWKSSNSNKIYSNNYQWNFNLIIDFFIIVR